MARERTGHDGDRSRHWGGEDSWKKGEEKVEGGGFHGSRK